MSTNENVGVAKVSLWQRHAPNRKMILTLIPIAGGIAIAAGLMVAMCVGGDNGYFNALNWSLVAYSPTKMFAVLYILLLADIVVVSIGTAIYFRDFQRSLKDHGRLAGNWFDRGQTTVQVCGLIILGWVGYFLYVVFRTNNNLDAGGAVSKFVDYNTYFSAALFFGFLLCDWFNYKGCRSAQRASEQEGCAAKVELFEQRSGYCSNSIWLIDIPVLAGCAMLIIVSKVLIGGTFGHEELQHLGTIQAAKFAEYFASYHTPVGVQTRFEQLLTEDFGAGFSTGSLICELAFSQIVLMVLNWRLLRTTSRSKV